MVFHLIVQRCRARKMIVTGQNSYFLNLWDFGELVKAKRIRMFQKHTKWACMWKSVTCFPQFPFMNNDKWQQIFSLLFFFLNLDGVKQVFFFWKTKKWLWVKTYCALLCMPAYNCHTLCAYSRVYRLVVLQSSLQRIEERFGRAGSWEQSSSSLSGNSIWYGF